MTHSPYYLPDRKLLRLSAILLVIGLLLSIAVGLLHPSQEDANNHPAVFSEYANSTSWTAVHLGQFVGMAVIIAGLLVLNFALSLNNGSPSWISRLAAGSAGLTLGLYGILQAVDGVTLKRAVDAWAIAPAAEKAARFASAEGIRWLEEGIRSYQDFMLGLTFLLFGIVIIWTARAPRPIGYLMGLSGLAYMVQGWVIGVEGFSTTHGLTQLPAYLFLLAWIVWLLVAALQMKPQSVQAAHR